MWRGLLLTCALVSGCVLKTDTSSTFPGSGSSTSSSSGSSGDDRASGAATGGNVTVPDVVGKTQAEAEATVRSAGLRGGIKVNNDPGSYDGATAKVCQQTPGGGQQSAASLFVSVTFCMEQKPYVDDKGDVTGLTLEAATKKARADGFTGEIKTAELYEYDKDCKDGTVCRFDQRRYYLNIDRSVTFYFNRKLTITAPE